MVDFYIFSTELLREDVSNHVILIFTWNVLNAENDFSVALGGK